MFDDEDGPLDLGSIRFAPALMPLAEILNSLHELSRALWTGRLIGWQKQAASCLPSLAKPLYDLVAMCGSTVSFLAPREVELDQALRAVHAVPDVRVQHELRVALGDHELPPWLPAFIGTSGHRDRLTTALRAYFHACLMPYWDDAHLRHELELITYSQSVIRQGMRRTLAQLTQLPISAARMDSRPLARHESRNRTITLAPSPFWTGEPTTRIFPDGEVRIIYRTSTALPAIPSGPGRRQAALDQLVGHTRAAILRNLATPCGTTELARRVCMSMATVSEQTTVLRATGLIVTTRRGKQVQHALTDLGRVLLQGRLVELPTVA
jgi:DNA-binding transcriptional ArsR family regulator